MWQKTFWAIEKRRFPDFFYLGFARKNEKFRKNVFFSKKSDFSGNSTTETAEKEEYYYENRSGAIKRLRSKWVQKWF